MDRTEHEEYEPVLCALCMAPIHGPRRFHDFTRNREKVWAHPLCQIEWENE